MINFKKNFLINFFKEEIRSGTKNGITVMDKAIAFSPSKVAPTHPNVKLFDAYIELYSQIEKGSFNWYLDDKNFFSSVSKRLYIKRLGLKV